MLSRSPVDRAPVGGIQGWVWAAQCVWQGVSFSQGVLWWRNRGKESCTRDCGSQWGWGQHRNVKEKVTDLVVMNKWGLYSAHPSHSSLSLIMEPKKIPNTSLPFSPKVLGIRCGSLCPVSSPAGVREREGFWITLHCRKKDGISVDKLALLWITYLYKECLTLKSKW